MRSAVTTNQTYLGYKTLTTYDTSECAFECDQNPSCQGFNLYLERDPTVAPANTTRSCHDPASLTNIKCSWWSEAIGASVANVTGETRAGFEVVIAGSNGYNKVAAFLFGYRAADVLPGYILGGDSVDDLFFDQFFQGPYDASQCANACNAITADNRVNAHRDGNYSPCNYFNAWELVNNGVVRGTVCAYYGTPQPASAATGQYPPDRYGYPEADVLTVGKSYGYSREPQDAGRVGNETVVAL